MDEDIERLAHEIADLLATDEAGDIEAIEEWLLLGGGDDGSEASKRSARIGAEVGLPSRR